MTVLRLSFDRPVAVVGDIHGRADLLEALLRRLPADMPLLIAGDVCDRGPDTRGVIDLLIARNAQGVMGNHEQWLIRWASRQGFDSAALSPMMGGDPTLASYRVEGRTPREVEAEAWRVSRAHRDWLDQLSIAVDLEVQGQPYWVIHAGIPSTESLAGLTLDQVVPWLAEHRPDSLLWSATDPREMLPVGRAVIMGHVPQSEPVDTGEVIALDTGAGKAEYSRLTAVVLPERRFVIVE